MGKLPEGWAMVTLAEVTLPFETMDPRRSPENVFVYIDIGSIDNKTQTITKPKMFVGRDAPSRARRVVAKGDVLFSTVRTYLKNIALVPVELDGQLTSTGITVLRASEAIESRYLFHFVRSEKFIFDISKAQDGTLYPAVVDKDVNGASAPLPPLAEQGRIVAKIDSLTARTRRTNNDLDRIPPLVAKYKARLLELGTTGELTREWRTIRNLPEGGFVRLERVATGINYGTSAKSSKEGKIPVLRMGNIQEGKLDWSDLVFTSDSDEIEKYRLEVGDVLFNRTNSPELVGKTAVYKGEREAIFAGYLIRVRCGDELVPDYLGYCLNCPSGRRYSWQVKSDGVSQSNINAKKLAAFEFLLPTKAEQLEIVHRIETALAWLDRVSADHASASKLLSRLDAAILARAFRGGLVPQDPDDEPASVLLERIAAERSRRPRKVRARKTRAKATKENLMTLARNLEQVLIEADDWVPAQTAFQRCGMGDGALTDEIEQLYAQLRDLDKLGKLEAQAVTDDQGRKLYDRLRLRVA